MAQQFQIPVNLKSLNRPCKFESMAQNQHMGMAQPLQVSVNLNSLRPHCIRALARTCIGSCTTSRTWFGGLNETGVLRDPLMFGVHNRQWGVMHEYVHER